jgi:PIN domain nuclease of toxin-antitoxin system
MSLCTCSSTDIRSKCKWGARRSRRVTAAFGSLLVAQAQLEGLTLVTRDPVFDRYALAVLRA